MIESIKQKRKKKTDNLDEVYPSTSEKERGVVPEQNDGVIIRVQPSDDEYRDSDSDLSEEDNYDEHSTDSEIPSECESESSTDSADSSDDESETESAEREKLRLLRKDPAVNKLLNELMDQKMRKQERKSRRHSKGNITEVGKEKGGLIKGGDKAIKRKFLGQQVNRIKSPSDTTLYTPALKRNVGPEQQPLVLPAVRVNNVKLVNSYSMLDQISDFLEKIRGQSADATKKQGRGRDSHDDLTSPDEKQHTSGEEGEEVELDDQANAKQMGEDLIIQAEKFKASVAAPRGNEIDEVINIVKNVGNISDLLGIIRDNDDDDFFYVTSHVEPALKKKIEQGEFVDLECLLPKTRSQMMNDSQRLQQYVDQDGSIYFGPAQGKENRITGIRKLEQAFRVYAAIYCKANPNRSAEIWQYVYTINTAAYSYASGMSEKPHRSWARTYNQLWSVAMCEHLPKNSGVAQHSTPAMSSNSSGDWRDRCCWKFNRGIKCKKWNCSYKHRCTYCGNFNHNKQNCFKKKGYPTQASSSSSNTTNVSTTSSGSKRSNDYYGGETSNSSPKHKPKKGKRN